MASQDFPVPGPSREAGEFEAESLRSEKLDAELRETKQRLAARHRIIRELLARRLTLLEAAARFRAVNRSAPEQQRRLFRRYAQGKSEAEQHCRAVINNVAGFLPDGAWEEWVASLERELQGLLRDGNLRLPDEGTAKGSRTVIPRRVDMAAVAE